MNSRFRITNSSEQINLDLGLPDLQRLGNHKIGDEFRLYFQPSVEAQKLVSGLEEEKLSNITETLLVEPHYFNFSITPVTPELLAQENKQKVRNGVTSSSQLPPLTVTPHPHSESSSQSEQTSTTAPTATTASSTAAKTAVRTERRRTKAEKSIGRRGSLAQKLNLTGTAASHLFHGEKRWKPVPTSTSASMPSPAKAGGSPAAPLQGKGMPPPAVSRLSSSFSGGAGSSSTMKFAAVSSSSSAAAGAGSPFLPTTPIPVSELPPDSVRSPPTQPVPNLIPALSNLTPIPLKDLHRGGGGSGAKLISSPVKPAGGTDSSPAAPTTPARTAELVSIQVPMAGPDGTQVMQTINVPKSVLINASERPVLLTVTPKNGVNKGQKQIVVLSRNAGGIGAVAKPQSALLGSSLSSTPVTSAPPAAATVMLGQRPAAPPAASKLSPAAVKPPPGVSKLPAPLPNAATATSTSRSPSDINRLLSQVTLVSSAELQRQGILPGTGSPPHHQKPPTSSISVARTLLHSKQVVVCQSSPVTSPSIVSSSTSPMGPQLAVVQQLGSNTTRQVLVQPQQQQQLGGGQQRTASVVRLLEPVGGGSPGLAVKGQQRVIQAVIRPASAGAGGGGGTPGNNPTGQPQQQQVVMQNGKAVLLTPAAAATAPSPQHKLVISQNGQILQGAALSHLTGQIINTSTGQFLIGSNGQLIPTQKLIQTSGGPAVRYVAVSQGAVKSLSTTTTTTTSSTTPIAVSSLRLGSGGGLPNGSHLSPQLPVVVSAVRPPPNLVSRQITGVASPATSGIGGGGGGGGGNAVVVVADPAGGAAATTTTTTTTASAPLNRILNALSNRGLLTQQNGKFYYVGEKGGVGSVSSALGTAISSAGPVAVPAHNSSVVDQSPGSGAHQTQRLVQVAGSPQTQRLVQVVVSTVGNMDSFTASPSLVQMASNLMQNSINSSNSSHLLPASSGNTSSSLLLPVSSHLIPVSSHLIPASSHLIPVSSHLIPASSHLIPASTVTVVPSLPPNSTSRIVNGRPGGGNSSSGVVNATAVKKVILGGGLDPLRGVPGRLSFSYRDPRLPPGWYVSVETSAAGALRYLYFSPAGDKLRSLVEVSHYLENKLMMLPQFQNIPAPVNIPILSELSEENQNLVPNIQLPSLDANSPAIRQVDPEAGGSGGEQQNLTPFVVAGGGVKRAAIRLPPTTDGKKAKIVFY